MILEFTGELYVIKMKNDAKFEEDLTSQFKFDMRNLINFDPSTQKSQKFLFNGLFLAKYLMFQLRKYKGVMLNDHED